MRKRLIKLFGPIIQYFAKWYFAKPRKFSYKGVSAVVLPTVFFPQLTLSTRILMDFIDTHDLDGKSFLELGCGTAMISVLAAKKGAFVMASDMSLKALENAKINALRNDVNLKIVHSDLFDNINEPCFHFICINPPYYPKNPINDAEKAWFCGKNFEYFESLFKVLGNYFSKDSRVIMILSEDCEIDRIKNIALKNKLTFSKIKEIRKWGELNYIFRIQNVSKSP